MSMLASSAPSSSHGLGFLTFFCEEVINFILFPEVPLLRLELVSVWLLTHVIIVLLGFFLWTLHFDIIILFDFHVLFVVTGQVDLDLLPGLFDVILDIILVRTLFGSWNAGDGDFDTLPESMAD